MHTKSMSEMSHRLKEASLTYLQKKKYLPDAVSVVSQRNLSEKWGGGKKGKYLPCYNFTTCGIKFKQDKTFDSDNKERVVVFFFLKPRALVNIKLSLLGVQIKKAKLTVHRPMPTEDKGILQY